MARSHIDGWQNSGIKGSSHINGAAAASGEDTLAKSPFQQVVDIGGVNAQPSATETNANVGQLAALPGKSKNVAEFEGPLVFRELCRHDVACSMTKIRGNNAGTFRCPKCNSKVSITQNTPVFTIIELDEVDNLFCGCRHEKVYRMHNWRIDYSDAHSCSS